MSATRMGSRPEMMEGPHPRVEPLLAVARTAVRSQRADVLRLRALGTLGDLELDLLVLVQGLVALGLNRRVVNEDVVAAAVLSDEAEALFCVEPLNSALSHVLVTPLSGRETVTSTDPQQMRVTRRSDLP